MYKLIVFLVAAIPVVLFLRTIFFGRRSKVMQGAVADFKRHIDYLVWAILILIGIAIVYTVGKDLYMMWH